MSNSFTPKNYITSHRTARSQSFKPPKKWSVVTPKNIIRVSNIKNMGLKKQLLRSQQHKNHDPQAQYNPQTNSSNLIIINDQLLNSGNLRSVHQTSEKIKNRLVRQKKIQLIKSQKNTKSDSLDLQKVQKSSHPRPKNKVKIVSSTSMNTKIDWSNL